MKILSLADIPNTEGYKLIEILHNDSTILCRVNKDPINRCHYLVNDKTNEVCFKELKGWKRYES